MRSDRWRSSGQEGKLLYAERASHGVPNLRSLYKLLEVGVSPYLGFILCLRVMLMFELNKAVRGRLIDPKS